MSGIPAGAGQLLGKRLGKFEILALLALGGTAEIYLARIGGAAGFEKYVVVKCLHDHLADDAEFVKMFLDEARLAAHLDHSNIVQTMELGQHEGRYYMVMEFLAGLSLAMIVRRTAERLPNARIPVPLVLNILAQAAAGLHYAHEKAMNGKPLNIVHRDISPQNLVISFEGVVKVVDFGIAKAELRETRTRSGTIKGKFAYMSPEQCVANNVDRRTDVFALGVIGHELLTGRRLFKRPSPYETYQAVIECDVKPPSTIDPSIDAALDAVIMRALTRDKEVRYATAEAFGDALLGYLHYRGIGSGPGDVSRFFDTYFGQELDEHSGRMRELISGREFPVETGVNWNGDDSDEEAKRDAAALAGSGSLVRESGDIEELKRPSAHSLSHALGELDGGSRVEDDDEMPAERTRIETNPLERINELDREVSKGPPPKVSKSGRMAPSVPVPAPPPGIAASEARAAQAASPPLRPSGMPPSGRFPDLANLPTMVAAGDVIPPELDGFGNLPTTVVPHNVPPAAASFANAPTHRAPSAATSFANAPTGLAPPRASEFANAPTSVVPLIPMADVHPPIPGASAFANAPTSVAPSPMGGYPVMNAQLSAQIATGATVFPSTAGGASHHASGAHARSGEPSGGYDPNGHAGNGTFDPSLQNRSGAHVLHGSGAHAPQGAAPQAMAMNYPQVADSAGYLLPSDNLSDAQRAANLMSPVGQHYPQQVNWAAAAATRARAVPPWLLGILFVAAIGIALALTIVMVRALR